MPDRSGPSRRPHRPKRASSGASPPPVASCRTAAAPLGVRTVPSAHPRAQARHRWPRAGPQRPLSASAPVPSAHSRAQARHRPPPVRPQAGPIGEHRRRPAPIASLRARAADPPDQIDHHLIETRAKPPRDQRSRAQEGRKWQWKRAEAQSASCCRPFRPRGTELKSVSALIVGEPTTASILPPRPFCHCVIPPTPARTSAHPCPCPPPPAARASLSSERRTLSTPTSRLPVGPRNLGLLRAPPRPFPPLPIPLSIGSRATTRHPEPAAMERGLGGEVSLRIPPNTPARTPAHPCPCPQSPGLAGACRARDERSSPSHRPTPCPLILSLSKDPPLPPIRPS